MPLGEDDDPRLWAKFFFNQPSGRRRANIHVRAAGNPNQRILCCFATISRAHPNSARTVELIKRQLAKYHADDIEAYYDIKDPVYDLIWDAAEDWARHTGWQPQNRDQSSIVTWAVAAKEKIYTPTTGAAATLTETPS